MGRTKNGPVGGTSILELRQEKLKSKRITKELREHAEEILEKSELMQDIRKSALAEQFKRSEENATKAKRVDQKLLDAQIFHKLGDYAKRQAAQMQTGLKDYDVTSFVDKLAQLMSQGQGAQIEGVEVEAEDLELDLHSLGRDMGSMFATAPSFFMLHGNSDVQQKPMKAKKAMQPARKGAETVKPAELEKGDIEVTETDKQVAKMFKELKRVKNINFWEFVVDPDSFMRSIENTFHSSFLVKDGHAKLDLASDPPTISFRDAKKTSAEATEAAALEKEAHAVNSQYILRFDHALWREVVEKYSITRCLLPSEPVGSTSLAKDKDMVDGDNMDHG
jgi:non-structural maintenance of chromosomes element 4